MTLEEQAREWDRLVPVGTKVIYQWLASPKHGVHTVTTGPAIVADNIVILIPIECRKYPVPMRNLRLLEEK